METHMTGFALQVFMTQTEHVSLRSQCLESMMMHKEEFQPVSMI